MCILFEICKKTPFQKCMGLGGRGCHFSAQHNTWDGAHKHSTAPLIHFYSESLSLSALLFSGRAGTPLGQTSPCLWTGTYFFNFCQCCEALVGCVFRSQNWAAKAVASAVVRMSCSLCVHAGCCEPAVRGLFALLADFSRVTCTQFAPPERALFRTKDFCGASGDATARGVNLYDDMVAACLQKQAESNTGIVQNGRNSQTYRQYSEQTWGVPNSPFQGLSEYTPHTPTSGTLSWRK